MAGLSPTTADAQASPASPQSQTVQAAPRVKRNTACVHCRDSKVKCNANPSSNLPCTRCAKLQLPCLVDRTYKRVSRRSKLEELQQEVRSIKAAVGKVVDPPPGLYTRTLPPVNARNGDLSSSSRGHSDHNSAALKTTLWSAQVTPALRPAQQTLPPIRPFDASLLPPLVLTPNGMASVPTPKTIGSSSRMSGLTAEPRALKSRAFSGDDICYYFEKYFEYFHPYFPIIRSFSPDTCYEAAPILFWTIVVTAARRFARDDTILPFLTEALPGVLWGTMANYPLPIGAINALLLLCAWPLTTVRFFRDPSTTYASIAMAACFQIGLHTGRGDYLDMMSNMRVIPRVANEEATFTWAGLNVVSQRVSSYTGFPPTGQFFNKTIESILDRSCPVSVPPSFVLLLECARFSNRVAKTVTASLEENRGISHHLVEMLEEDFDKIQRCFSPTSDLDYFTLLSTRQDVQLSYFLPEPDPSPDIFKRNVLKTYSTAQLVVRQAGVLQEATAFLLYAPHFVFRTLAVSTIVVVTVLLSPYMKDIPVAEKDTIVQEAIKATRVCAVTDAELPARIMALVESYWTTHHLRPPMEIPTNDVSLFSHRQCTRFPYGHIMRWKRDMEASRMSSMGTSANRKRQATTATATATVTGAGTPGPPSSTIDLTAVQPENAELLDWDAFMDDFDWGFSTPYLNPA